MTIDPLFGATGFYRHVLQSNALLHHEAGKTVVARLRNVLDRAPTQVRILDLACGGAPVTVAGIMRAWPDTAFTYLGIDIHPDQVAAARASFQFPANAVRIDLRPGDAWRPRLVTDGPFELVFMGMNLHHGTPAQVADLARELSGLLAPGGVFINHDWFRPDAEPYAAPGSTAPWRAAFRDGLRERLLAAGADAGGVQEVSRHVWANDFPVSRAEFDRAFSAAGLSVEFLELPPRLPLAQFIAVGFVTKQ